MGCSEHGAFSLPVHDLRQQMAALQSQLRQVQLERTTLTSRLKTSQAEIASLQSVRQWYQQQLALAQEARVRLQGEMAHIQVRPASPGQLPCKCHVEPLLFPDFPFSVQSPQMRILKTCCHSHSPHPPCTAGISVTRGLQPLWDILWSQF